MTLYLSSGLRFVKISTVANSYYARLKHKALFLNVTCINQCTVRNLEKLKNKAILANNF
jgi:hypothetical protein